MTKNNLQIASKPVMIWDDDCLFCQQSVCYWKKVTKENIEYQKISEAVGRYNGLSTAFFKKAITLIEPDGRILTGAAAIFRTLSYQGYPFLYTAYCNIKIFRFLSRKVYSFVSSNRNTLYKFIPFFLKCSFKN